ncbi:hypothetical protein FDECE_7386 [Fusarium decemcellulare]|nr:hypothetical protein FDECE_7386 [Fusarium decemcellulare]
MAASLSGLDSLSCEYIVPTSDTPLNVVNRWSDTKIERPALVVTPKNEQDVQAAIRIARDNKLTIVTGGGGHGTFVIVGPSSLYLDMKNFKKIDLNKENGTVQVGGGVVAGELLKTLAAEGYYTPLTNSNAVGVVGAIIGGGNTPWTGLHGWMADIVISFNLVTAAGEIVHVSGVSTGKDLALFNALCGAGHGLGVITSVETSAYPISRLNMTDDKIWTRTLIFPPPALETAAQAFLDLSRLSPAAGMSLAFARSPPGTPAAGAPIVALGFAYFGPAEEGEREAALLFKEDVAGKAIFASTDGVPIPNLNDKFEPQNVHGGHKAIASCRLEKIDLAAIKAAFEKWLAATTEYPDAQMTPLVISATNSTRYTEAGQMSSGAAKFLECRNRGLSAMIVAICQKEDTRVALAKFMDDTIAVIRKGDEGTKPRSFPNNLRFGVNLEEMFDKERLEELRGVKKLWDADGIFWSPYEA